MKEYNKHISMKSEELASFVVRLFVAVVCGVIGYFSFNKTFEGFIWGFVGTLALIGLFDLET